jgi:integral membrane protein
MKTTSWIPLQQLRLIGNIEGVSYLFLLIIAMPVKYCMDYPELVKYTGWVHGVLFIAFTIAAVRAKYLYKFSFLWFIWAMTASIIPLGTFVLDRQLKKVETAG